MTKKVTVINVVNDKKHFYSSEYNSLLFDPLFILLDMELKGYLDSIYS